MTIFSELDDQIASLCIVIGGAGLGASFYVLMRSQPYLANRSYDPKYNAVYVTRFITGVIAGVILSVALGPMLVEKMHSSAGTALTPGVLAILGGYAAEAVELILQRIVEIILAVIRGDNSAQVDAKAAVTHQKRAAEVDDATHAVLSAPTLADAKTAALKLKAAARRK